ncbi:energy transducer TonB [Granulicella tundricola]|uniref:TonB family protein n=1 Tax=Granulicella tundricola (strain ATCC BAA-1859 / DSM 23138 / MP5ACTX9) TaxID=1198114 RepID=E8X332_GRATM|nr:energy transducer TonB [Granulicella tundricola]ADW69256.1 TonB family protein [Granulicella tundricola MP5ACTX9]
MQKAIFGLLLMCGMVLSAGAQQGVDMPKHVIRVSGGVMAGRAMTKVDPVYPPEAREKKISEVVVLHAVIGADGTVKDLNAVSGPGILIASALEAVRQWTYEAYVLNGNTVAVDTTITANYSLDK